MPKQTDELFFSSELAVGTLFALSIEVRGDHKENEEPRVFAGGIKFLFIILCSFSRSFFLFRAEEAELARRKSLSPHQIVGGRLQSKFRILCIYLGQSHGSGFYRPKLPLQDIS